MRELKGAVQEDSNSNPQKALKVDLAKVTNKVFTPFESEDKLPAPVYDKNGKPAKPGQGRFKFEGNDLVKVYRTGNGVSQQHYKTFSKDKPEDRAFRNALKKVGIPGA